MWLFSATLALVAADDDSTMATFLGQECDDSVTPKVFAKGGQPGDKVKDLAECVKLCEASDDCQSVTYYHRESWTDSNKITHKEHKWCKHFYTACGSLKKSGGATTVTHLAKMDSYWSLAPIGFGRQCQGTPLSSSGTPNSLKKCMTTCDAEPDCKSVTFSDKTCSHYNTKCENSPTNDRKEDMVSMVRRTDQRGALQSKCDTGKGANGLPREKWLKALAVADLAACEKSCHDEPKCQSITFWKHGAKNCNHFETKCLYRQPQSMAIAKSLKLDMPKSEFCRSANSVCDCSYRCKPGFTFAADQNKVGKCSANKCRCPNGSAKTGAACAKDGAAMCESCKDGYYMNVDQTKCSANKCRCPNGLAKTGAACAKDGADMCESCKDGYIISKDQTKCSDKRAKLCSSPNVVCTYSCKPGYTINKDQSECSRSRWAPKSKAELQAAIVACLNAWDFGCSKGLRGPIGNWDVSAVTDMRNLLSNVNTWKPLPGVDKFNGDVSKWDVSSATDMDSMFGGATSFNCDLSKWDVSSVTTMHGMFFNAKLFNADLSKWDVSSVKDMRYMFGNAASFDSDLSKWDVSSVTDMSSMFSSAVSFNADLSKWDLSSVYNMASMFNGAKSFAQTLCGAWKTAKVSKGSVFTGSQGKWCANVCRCPNGSPKVDAACAKHGADMCASCKSGFNLNADQTQCSHCSAGYTNDGAKGCKDLNECLKNNGGCDRKRKCINTVGSFKCGDCPAADFANDGAKGCKRRPLVIACIYHHTLVAKADGTLWAAGEIGVAAFVSGMGHTIERKRFEQMSRWVTTSSGMQTSWFEQVKSVSAALDHIMVVKQDGTLWARGMNGCGQLGGGPAIQKWYNSHRKRFYGSDTDVYAFIKVMSGVKSVAAGYEYTMVVKKDGTLWATGRNKYGQLGDGTNTDTYRFKQVMSGVKAVVAGGAHTMVVKQDDTLWATGRNYFGQLGDGTDGATADRNTFKQVLTGVKDVAAGDFHTMVLKQDGTLWGTGYNRHGELGYGSTTNRNTFKQVLTEVKAVATGWHHTMVVKQDDTLWAAGRNDLGELGDGTSTSRTPFKQVLTGVQAVAAGGYHTMVVKQDGSLWATGDNDSGQLGDGTKVKRKTFKQIYL